MSPMMPCSVRWVRASSSTKEWFIEERLLIAARCIGAAERALVAASDWANGREQFGHPIADYQFVQGVLADAAVEIAVNRSFLYQIAADAGATDPKVLHARSAMAKLAASEAAGRVLDGCVQLMGGRGLMREFPVERIYRSVRSERIWEGTSDIQRLIVANHIRKRGIDDLVDVARLSE